MDGAATVGVWCCGPALDVRSGSADSRRGAGALPLGQSWMSWTRSSKIGGHQAGRPLALTTASVFTPRGVGRAGYDGVQPSADPRAPMRALALSQSSLDYVDLHMYPTGPHYNRVLAPVNRPDGCSATRALPIDHLGDSAHDLARHRFGAAAR